MSSLCAHSSLGGNTINEVALDFWRAGQAREEISLELLEQRLRRELQDAAGKSWVCSGGAGQHCPTHCVSHRAAVGGSSPHSRLLTMRAPDLLPVSQGTWGGRRPLQP